MSKTLKFQPPPVFEEVIYPESDGKPMAETEIHVRCLIGLLETLSDFFRNDPKTYVAGNMFVYYQQGDTRKQVAPDVFVVKGVEKKLRRYYQIWKEGKAPDVVFEITSESTQWEDLDSKRKLYRRLGIKEYYLYDPTGDYLKDRFLGYRLVGNRFVQVRLPKGGDRVHSDVLGLDLVMERERLRLYDPQAKRFLLTPSEVAEAYRRTEEENARLRAELERLQKQQSGVARTKQRSKRKKA
jgi:Uma2 family endonuclease